MPIKLGLVMSNKQHLQKHSPPERSIAKKLTPEIIPEIAAQQPKGISLRRVMGAPKTGCKSCRG